MNLFPSHIKLKGKQTSINDLLENASRNTEWEKNWLNFLSEWYMPTNYIEVKTSGSTGNPKTIQLQKTFVAASAQRTIKYFRLKEGDKVLHCMPSKYIAGKLMIIRALLGKLDLYLVDPTTNFEFLANEHFKFAAMVPNQVAKIFNLKLETWKLQQLLIGGDAIPNLLESKLQNVQTACYSSYGMTETATHIALRKINGNNADLFYHCLDDIHVKLSHTKCLQLFVPGLPDQPLQTNDLAELTNEKTFRILGRTDNMIISGGIKFSPEQLEKKLEAHINQPFMISSVPHEKLGQQLTLLLEGVETPQTKSKLQIICQEQLSKYEQPRQIIFVSQLPRTANGKLKR